MSEAIIALRNHLHLGAYQQVINQLSQRNLSSSNYEQDLNVLIQKCLLYRAYLGQAKYNLILTDLEPTASSPTELQAIRTLAQLQQFQTKSQLSSRPHLAVQQAAEQQSGGAPPTPTLAETVLETTEVAVLEAARALVAEPVNLVNPQVVVSVATIFYRLGQLEEALRTLAHCPKDLECLALTIQTLLFLDRTDLAQREVANLKSWAEDDSLAVLMEAWVNLRLGGSKYRDALYIFEELAQASPVPTIKLLTSQAICNLHLGRLPEAESLLLEALDKDSNDPDVLANMVVCSTLMQKPSEVRARYLNQLREAAPSHPLVATLDHQDAMFDECAAKA
ncbi:hypothetical protein H4R33_002644 [Dimargaris cristalligena]|nr:hypothetical protein H4R33_002644 [Dimargaris cristalligena]